MGLFSGGRKILNVVKYKYEEIFFDGVVNNDDLIFICAES